MIKKPIETVDPSKERCSMCRKLESGDGQYYCSLDKNYTHCPDFCTLEDLERCLRRNLIPAMELWHYRG